jgi:hypothetical protein
MPEKFQDFFGFRYFDLSRDKMDCDANPVMLAGRRDIVCTAPHLVINGQ